MWRHFSLLKLASFNRTAVYVLTGFNYTATYNSFCVNCFDQIIFLIWLKRSANLSQMWSKSFTIIQPVFSQILFLALWMFLIIYFVDNHKLINSILFLFKSVSLKSSSRQTLFVFLTRTAEENFLRCNLSFLVLIIKHSYVGL